MQSSDIWVTIVPREVFEKTSCFLQCNINDAVCITDLGSVFRTHNIWILSVMNAIHGCIHQWTYRICMYEYMKVIISLPCWWQYVLNEPSHQLPSALNITSNDSHTDENDLKYSHKCKKIIWFVLIYGHQFHNPVNGTQIMDNEPYSNVPGWQRFEVAHRRRMKILISFKVGLHLCFQQRKKTVKEFQLFCLYHMWKGDQWNTPNKTHWIWLD